MTDVITSIAPPDTRTSSRVTLQNCTDILEVPSYIIGDVGSQAPSGGGSVAHSHRDVSGGLRDGGHPAPTYLCPSRYQREGQVATGAVRCGTPYALPFPATALRFSQCAFIRRGERARGKLGRWGAGAKIAAGSWQEAAGSGRGAGATWRLGN